MKPEIRSGIFGLAVGDALGVPAEFKTRMELLKNPVTDMVGFGTHEQPKGTWSDDTTMTLCLAESLKKGVDYGDIMGKFLRWAESGYMTPHGKMFDIGGTTLEAVRNFAAGEPPLECGGKNEHDNGNGSLMRILPAALYAVKLPVKRQFEVVHNISKLTHAHPRSLIACGFYAQLALALHGGDKEGAAKTAVSVCMDHYRRGEEKEELSHFSRLMEGPESFAALPENQIKSSGYVVETLEAAVWCLLRTGNYRECVLKAVNLGGDTDTTGAVAGSLAGILYGYDAIPSQWIDDLVKKELIEEVCGRFEAGLKHAK